MESNEVADIALAQVAALSVLMQGIIRTLNQDQAASILEYLEQAGTVQAEALIQNGVSSFGVGAYATFVDQFQQLLRNRLGDSSAV